jgi:hypothetical protein
MAGHGDLAQAGHALRRAAERDDCTELQRLLCSTVYDPVALLMSTDDSGDTAFLLCAYFGNLDGMRLLLDHPSADAAAMLTDADAVGLTGLMQASEEGQEHAMRLMLDHPSADAAAMMAVRGPGGVSALTIAALFAAGAGTESSWYVHSENKPSCPPLLLLLRRVAVQPEPSDEHQAHMTEVMEAFFSSQRFFNNYEDEEQEERSPLFDTDKPNDARDECVLCTRRRRLRLTQPCHAAHHTRVRADGARAAAPQRGGRGGGARAAAGAAAVRSQPCVAQQQQEQERERGREQQQ